MHTKQLYWKPCSLARERLCSRHTNPHIHNDALGTALVGLGLEPQEAWSSLLGLGSLNQGDSHPFARDPGLLLVPSWLTAAAFVLTEEGEAGSWAGILDRGLEDRGGAEEGQACLGRLLQSSDDAFHPRLVWGCTELVAP